MKRALDTPASLAAFFAIAFGTSWACWIPAAFATAGVGSSWARWLAYAGALGPAVAGITLTYCADDRQLRRDYWERATDFSRIRRRWFIPILLLYPLATLIALLLDTAVTGAEPDLRTAIRLLSDPRSLVMFPIWVLLLGPLPEELGWRGYALDRLQRYWSPLMSSIVLGVLWAFWHLPLFFINSSYQHGLGLGSLSFWSYGVTIVELSVLFTWIHNANARSTLAAILFHFVLNFTGLLAKGSPVAEVTKAVIIGIAAAVVVLNWTPDTAGSSRRRNHAEAGSDSS